VADGFVTDSALPLFGDDRSRLFIDAGLGQLRQDSIGVRFFFESLGRQRDRLVETRMSLPIIQRHLVILGNLRKIA
jgi:hypothetical protein